MKSKKINKLFSILGFTSIASGLVASSMLVSSCSNDISTTSEVATATTKETPNQASPIQYITITFDDTDEDVVLTGPKKVRIVKGKPFGTITPPKATKKGLKFEGWSYDAFSTSQMVASTDILTEDTTIYPIFVDRLLLEDCVGVTAIESTIITFENHGENTPNIQYSRDYGDNWATFPTIGVELNPGDNLFIIGDNYTPATEGTPAKWEFSTSAENYTSFHFTPVDAATGCSVNLGGNIMGLLDGGRGKDDAGDAKFIPCDYCFYHLFEVDSVKVPGSASAINYVSNTFLPATSLTQHCYDGLFFNCSTMIYAPWLPATGETTNALPTGCYNNLFYGCSSLQWIKLSYAGEINSTCFENWVQGLTRNSDYEFIYDGPTTTEDVSAIPVDWTVAKTPVKPETGDAITVTCTDSEATGQYTFVANHPYQFAATVNTTGASQRVTWVSQNTSIADVNPDTGVVTGIKTGVVKIYAYSVYDLNIYGSKEISVRNIETEDCVTISPKTSSTTVRWDYIGTGLPPSFEYSTDGKIWSVFWSGTTVNVPSEKQFYIKGNNNAGLTDGKDTSYTRFTISGSVDISGSVMGLIDDGRGEKAAIPCAYCFKNLFSSNSSIVNVSSGFLPATTLSVGCYQGMFSNCTSLETVPDLRVTNLNTYDYCYQRMFYSCKKLQYVPDLYDDTKTVHDSYLPATTLSKGCYQGMFMSCDILENSVYLPAKVATAECYSQMYQECKQLKYAYPIDLENLETESCFQVFPHRNAAANNPFTDSYGSTYRLIFTCPNSQHGYSETNVSMMFPYSANPDGGATPGASIPGTWSSWGMTWYCKNKK